MLFEHHSVYITYIQFCFILFIFSPLNWVFAEIDTRNGVECIWSGDDVVVIVTLAIQIRIEIEWNVNKKINQFFKQIMELNVDVDAKP